MDEPEYLPIITRLPSTRRPDDPHPPTRVYRRDVERWLRAGHTWRGYITGAQVAPGRVRPLHERVTITSLAGLAVECERQRGLLNPDTGYRLGFWQDEEAAHGNA